MFTFFDRTLTFFAVTVVATPTEAEEDTEEVVNQSTATLEEEDTEAAAVDLGVAREVTACPPSAQTYKSRVSFLKLLVLHQANMSRLQQSPQVREVVLQGGSTSYWSFRIRCLEVPC